MENLLKVNYILNKFSKGQWSDTSQGNNNLSRSNSQRVSKDEEEVGNCEDIEKEALLMVNKVKPVKVSKG